MVTDLGRSPYGERGLKLRARLKPSFPTSRSPYGERGLKYCSATDDVSCHRRSPYGERGLKSAFDRYAIC